MTDTLLLWFAEHARALPWRQNRSPYRVWLAEIMLQQTQVATVVPYYERWLEHFPTVQALAAASLDEVLKLWEGLGYYRRARMLHEAAKRVVAEYGGVFPSTYDGLLSLPGVGFYTAAAVASLAFGEDVIAVDGNVKRVAARLFTLAGDIKEAEVKRKLEPLLPPTRAGMFNEALMELGATVCTPAKPACERCPVSAYCLAFQTGQVAQYPEPKAKKRVPRKHRYAHVYLREGSLILRQRPPDEMLGGLWGFPLSDEAPAGTPLPNVRHAYTHFHLTVTPTLVDTPPAGARVTLEHLPTLALSTLDHKILTLIRNSFLVPNS